MNYKVDYDKLREGLEKLTGNDFNYCEMAERRAGNMHGDLAFSKAFQARLGARALKEDIGIIKALPIYDYNQLCWSVSNFLQFGSDPTKAVLDALESQQDQSTDSLPPDSESTDPPTIG